MKKRGDEIELSYCIIYIYIYYLLLLYCLFFVQCSMFSRFDDNEDGFIFHCAKRGLGHKVSQNLPPVPLCVNMENMEQTNKINDLQK